MEIPSIQRDYAQGRDDERSKEIRDQFLKALLSALVLEGAEHKCLDLDFVYGNWVQASGTLEPLDGQQRLTTLFLLHWYAACMDNAFEEFNHWISSPSSGSNFSYRTRPSAREFIDALVEHQAPVGKADGFAGKLSDWIQDAVWFVRSWRRDPTVRGCLTMLDDIHSRFQFSNGIWRRLVSTASPPISFHILLLENFNLSDDLYIKMNARGKALSRFEVFKAEFERFIGDTFIEETSARFEGRKWREFVAARFDTKWTDFIWTQPGCADDLDSSFLHLVRAIALVHSVRQDDESKLFPKIRRLLAEPEPGIASLRELGILDRKLVENLVEFLEILSSRLEGHGFLRGDRYLDETDLFRRVLRGLEANQDDGLTLIDWLKFFSWTVYVIDFSGDREEVAADAWFHDWIRVTSNLADNSDIDRTERLIAALRGARELSTSIGEGFLSTVADGALDKIGGFNQQQQREETLKAQLILRDRAWAPAIERAETHCYFRGDIGFLLQFCGITDKAKTHDPRSWSEEENSRLLDNFNEWYGRVCAVFPEEAASWPRRFDEFLWERALLATGEYMLPKGRNLSFLEERDRDASWKRLLRGDTQIPDKAERRDVVRRVLQQVDVKNVDESLRQIVARGVQGEDDFPVPGIRRLLVGNHQLIEYCEKRMIRIEDGTAYLLPSVGRRGGHVDLYVYDLYFRLDGRKEDLVPFGNVKLSKGSDTYLPSKVVLCAQIPMCEFAIEKSGPNMALTLTFAEPQSVGAGEFETWNTEDRITFRCKVPPDGVEAFVLKTATTLRKYISDV